MPTGSRALSTTAETVLELIAQGHSYEQILSLYPKLTYLDIFRAAQEALKLAGETRNRNADRLAEIRKEHPRAYEPWSADEDADLSQMAREGASVEAIAARLQRQPTAINSRLLRLGSAGAATSPLPVDDSAATGFADA